MITLRTMLIRSLAVLVVGGPAYAVDVVTPPDVLRASPSAQLSFPGTFGVPSAVAPIGGTGFIGATYANPRGGAEGAGGDGDLLAGYSIGNPVTGVSLTFSLAVTGVDPFGDAGSLSLSASRFLRAGDISATFAGVSVSNLAPWGPNAERPEMFSAYVSHLIGAPAGSREIPVQIVAGYGSDNTRRTDGSAVLDDGFFAGIGIGLTPTISGGLSATSTQVNVGASVSIPNTNIGVTIGVLDVMDNTDRQQVSVSFAYGF